MQLRRRRQVAVNNTVDALNWLSGGVGASANGRLVQCHTDAWADISAAHDEYGGAPVLVPSEAARALPGHKAGYGLDATFRPFQKDLLSLPSEAWSAPMATSVLGEAERVLLEGLAEMSLRSEEEKHDIPEVKPYWDPVLRNNRKQYIAFVQMLSERGLVTWRWRRRSAVSVLCVAKKNGMLRLVVDARGSNRIFKDPPGVSLTTVEGIANIHVDQNDKLFISKGDVENCFYRLRIEGSICEFFALESVSASEVGIDECEGLHAEPSSQMFPCFSVLPMGFSWSLFLLSMPCNVL